MQPPGKAEGAFKTIGEVAAQTGLAPHILRYWETRFPQLRPLQRAGNRRYYRAADVELVLTIDRLVNREGYTIRGVQQMLATPASRDNAMFDVGTALRRIRDSLARAIAADDR